MTALNDFLINAHSWLAGLEPLVVLLLGYGLCIVMMASRGLRIIPYLLTTALVRLVRMIGLGAAMFANAVTNDKAVPKKTEDH